VQRIDEAELLDRGQRRPVAHLDRARPDPDRRGRGRGQREHDGRGGAGDAGVEVVLGEPVPGVAKTLRGLGEIDAVPQRLRGGGARADPTANAVTSLSLDPPLILVCFDLGSQTLRAIRGHGAFVVNVLAAGQEHLSAGFARRGLAAAWDGVRHWHGPTGSPRLDGVLAVLECTVEHRLPGGDHEIVIGRVRHAETSATPAAPLVFFRGGYASLAS
jgi:flavin reductase (DIM6/NTAB) family NADH-FMN oxidoreductase RutF